ncbi:MAG: DUF2299 family protein [Deltaproteobacteria bacterium]|nr:DUF2299 family protein [Deltaproteobacteria bacterium]
MSVQTPQEAQELIAKWLTDNGHDAKVVKDENASFHFEVDYPMNSMKRQRIIQPKEYNDLLVVLNGVSIADEHKEELKKMTPEERDVFYDDIRKALIFLDNSYDMNLDDDEVAQQVQFSYEFYFDALTKTQLYKALLLNHRTLLYIVTIFNEKFGAPEMQSEEPHEHNA